MAKDNGGNKDLQGNSGQGLRGDEDPEGMTRKLFMLTLVATLIYVGVVVVFIL